MDVITTFQHWDLDEDIFMIQPKGFEVEKQEYLVCKLKKFLYGLKLAHRQWYKKFNSYIGYWIPLVII